MELIRRNRKNYCERKEDQNRIMKTLMLFTSLTSKSMLKLYKRRQYLLYSAKIIFSVSTSYKAKISEYLLVSSVFHDAFRIVVTQLNLFLQRVK